MKTGRHQGTKGDVREEEEAQREGSQGDVPGGPVVRALHFQRRAERLQSLIGELRFHMSCGAAKKATARRKQIKKKPMGSEEGNVTPVRRSETVWGWGGETRGGQNQTGGKKNINRT